MRFITIVLSILLAAGCAGRRDAPPVTASPEDAQTVRFAVFNVYLTRMEEGDLLADLQTGENVQIQKVAEIIQRTAPDVLVLNEFDYDEAGESLRIFQQSFLEVGWNGAERAVYPYAYIAPSNTGIHSGHDLNRDGAIVDTPGTREYGDDAFGFGSFPGQYAMAFLSKYPIAMDDIRTFQRFVWKDMPGARLPDNPETAAPADWYGAEALEVFRLASKSYWDIPVLVDGRRVHILASHPTPPAFDGEENRNGKRNHDEIRFWADYVTPGLGDYIYDDDGQYGGLGVGERFVIMGDLNADPNDGNAKAAIRQFLDAPGVAQTPAPRSRGGAVQAVLQGGANIAHKGDPAEDTADFYDDPEAGVGNLRVDHVIFSKAGFREKASGVFWPAPDEPYYELVGPGYPVESSDHRLVWRDLTLTD